MHFLNFFFWFEYTTFWFQAIKLLNARQYEIIKIGYEDDGLIAKFGIDEVLLKIPSSIITLDISMIFPCKKYKLLNSCRLCVWIILFNCVAGAISLCILICWLVETFCFMLERFEVYVGLKKHELMLWEYNEPSQTQGFFLITWWYANTHTFRLVLSKYTTIDCRGNVMNGRNFSLAQMIST